MSKINIEVLDGQKPDTEPDASEIGKTESHQAPGEDEAGGRAHPARMCCWYCKGISIISVSDYNYHYYRCCYCNAVNGPF